MNLVIFIFLPILNLLNFSNVNCEFFVIDNEATNATADSWFNMNLLKEFLSDDNASTSAEVFEGFKKMISFTEKPPKKTSAWVPQKLSDIISRINSNSKKEEIKSKPLLWKKLNFLKEYLEQHFSKTNIEKNKEPEKNKGFFSFEFGWKNKTGEIEDLETSKIRDRINVSEKQFSDAKMNDSSQNDLKETSLQTTQMASNADLECEKNIIINFKECIERCKNNLRQIQIKTGGITPMNLSELNTCIQSCRQNAMNSTNCKLSVGSINLINEEIPIPKPTIRRFQKNEERDRNLIQIYIVEPILRFVTIFLFSLIGIVVILYYFKEYRIYPRFADYVTFKIESYYTEDEKRRAIFEGDRFPQQPKINWKRTIVYLIRLNFLPRFFANNFTWLVPTRDHYQQTTETSNYVRIQ